MDSELSLNESTMGKYSLSAYSKMKISTSNKYILLLLTVVAINESFNYTYTLFSSAQLPVEISTLNKYL